MTGKGDGGGLGGGGGGGRIFRSGVCFDSPHTYPISMYILCFCGSIPTSSGFQLDW